MTAETSALDDRQLATVQAYLRAPEAARYLGLSTSTVNKLRLTGGGPLYSRVGRRVLYRVQDLDAWVASGRRRSTAENMPTEARRPGRPRKNAAQY